MRLILFITFLLTSSLIFSQFNGAFQAAYNSYPNLPKGVLEAVSWSNTHMRNISSDEQESCIGIPQALGVMGLFYDGKDYFRENGHLVAHLSGVSAEQQLMDPNSQINAYAQAFSIVYSNYFEQLNSEAKALSLTLETLSEIPDSGSLNQFALDAQIYQVMRYMNNNEFAQENSFLVKNYDLASVFGDENLKVLSAKKVIISEQTISNELGNLYSTPVLRSAEYGPAIWDPVPGCNYSSRDGVSISAIAIHTIQGSYSGAISWAKNCSSNVSYHYVIRSSDGQVAQLVLEADKAWHIGLENPYTIGYEHEGWVDDASWYTEAMYQSSADLSIDITNSGYGIPPLRTYYGAASAGSNVIGGCTKIKGHQHYPNQTHTDPGIHWNWEKYYKLINNNPAITTVTNGSGTLYDTGGATGNYGNDERNLWLIQPAGATFVTLEFTEFEIEANWDYLFIYDGATTDAPLIGKYTGSNSPGTITSTGGSLLVEFRSDCATTAPGWAVDYSSSGSSMSPITSISQGNVWYTSNFMVNINDVSTQSVITERYYLMQDRSSNSPEWGSQSSKGFVSDNFNTLSNAWTQQTGDFFIYNNRLVNDDINSSNSNIYMNLNQTNNKDYLYSWTQRFTSSGSNQRGGFHFMCSDPTLPNRGESYFVFLRETSNKVQIYSVTNDAFSLETDDDFVIDNMVDYNVKVTYSPNTGWIRVYINEVLASSWKDPAPLQSGNSISFRGGNAEIEFDDLLVFQSRSSYVQIPIGASGLIRHESENGAPTGRMLALSKDNFNWSDIDTADFLIDKTSPVLNFINDGVGADINVFSGQNISGNWSFTETHSGIEKYEFAVGTSANQDDVVAWTNVGSDSYYTAPFTNGVHGQTYYISVKATNGAGLIAQASSNGQVYNNDGLSIEEEKLKEVVVYPNPFKEVLMVRNLPEKSDLIMYDMQGRVVYSSENNSASKSIYLDNVKNGVYLLKIMNGGKTVQHRVVKL